MRMFWSGNTCICGRRQHPGTTACAADVACQLLFNPHSRNIASTMVSHTMYDTPHCAVCQRLAGSCACYAQALWTIIVAFALCSGRLYASYLHVQAVGIGMFGIGATTFKTTIHGKESLSKVHPQDTTLVLGGQGGESRPKSTGSNGKETTV